ncbi:MAG: transcriptional activator domain protein, partial [Acidimicrobiales bacterium]|nr:transcriptional activator domain protein [Acidimicrobiales bacterium]
GGPGVLAEIPDGIRAAVRARLQPLPDLTVELLSAASILGAPIHVGVLAAMADREVEDVDAALAEAIAVGLLVERGSGLAFDHALVRDAVADQLPVAVRRAWHAAAALALAGRQGRPASAATVAQHLLDAGDLASAEEIGRWAEAAAGEARRVGAHGEVARWSEAAAGQWAVAGDLARQGAALKDAVRARVNGGDATGALASSDDLAALARESGSGVLLAQAALARAEVFQPAQELEAPPLLQEALAHPGLGAEPGLRTELLAATASLLGMPSAYGPRNDLDGARRAIAELADLAASGDARARAHLAEARLNVDSGPEHHLERREWLAELDDALPPGPGVFERLNRVYWATSLAFEAGDLQEVERRLREWESLAERADSHYWRWRGAMARASLAYARGRLDLAEDLAVASHPLVASLNPDMGFRVLAGLVFTIRRDQGRLAELAGAGPGAFGVLGALVAIEVGDLAEARRLLDQVAQLVETTGPDDLYWLCLMSLLAYGSEAVGDADRCRAAAEALEPYGDQCVMWGRSYVFGSPVAETLGVAHRGAGDLVRSAEWFRRSTAWADGAGAHGFAVRGRVGLASVLPPGPDRTALLAEARRGAEALGMAHALTEMARLDGVPAATPPIPTGPAVTAVTTVTAVTAIATVTSRARVRTLGRFEVVGAGTVEPARWSSRKARDALKMLIARRGRSIPREELIDLLWPDVDVSSGRNRLSVVLSMVRAALDPDKRLASDPLRADRQSVALDLNLVDVDLEAFLGSAAAGLAAAEDHLGDAADLLVEAIDLVDHGPFLAEDPYVDWAAATRSAVERTRREVLRSMARVAEETDPEAAITWWGRLIEVDPDDDAAFFALVGLLESAGRHGEVAGHYRAADQRRRALGLGGAD